MTPVTALAATVSGLARKTCASLWPMRPGKLRLVVLMQLIGVIEPAEGVARAAQAGGARRRRRSSPRPTGRLLRSVWPSIFSVFSPCGDLAGRRHDEGVDLDASCP